MDHFSRSIPEFPSFSLDNESTTKNSCMKTRNFPADFCTFRSLEQNTEKCTSFQLKLNTIIIVLTSSIFCFVSAYVICVVWLHYFMFLLPCCAVCYDFCVKTMFVSSYSICFVGTGVSSGTGTAYPPEAPEFTPAFFCGVRVAQSYGFFMLFSVDHCLSFCLLPLGHNIVCL